MKNPLVFLLQKLLATNKIKIDNEELSLQIQSHPSYPSLHSITGVLDHFNIENIALKVPVNKETLYQLPNNFITHINSKNTKEFALVTQKEKGIQIIYASKKKDTICVEEFLKIWNGIIVVVENENLESKNKESGFRYNAKILFTVVGILGLVVFFSSKPSLFESLHFIFSLIGVIISYLIVSHEFGFQLNAIDKLCSATEATSCDKVLNSKGAVVFGQFKLSDLSLIYFAGLIITWIMSASISASNTPLVLLTIAAILVMVYSIYYQYKVVKKWCPLCLAVVGILWLQFCSLFFLSNKLPDLKLDFTSSFTLFFSFILTASFWVFIKPLLEKQQELKKHKIEYYKFKRDFKLFNALYGSNKLIDTDIDINGEIVLGNREALINILLVTNPSCFYCKAAHLDMERLLKNKDLRITIRFNVPEHKNNISNKVASKLLEIYAKEPVQKCLVALHEAYEKDVDLNNWLINFGETKNNNSESLLSASKEWCIKNNVNFTPAFYVNGREYPKAYERADLLLFVDELIEKINPTANEEKEILITA